MHKITISGLAGSGKSTVGKLFASKLNVPFISMGNTTRAFAMEKYGMDINQFQELCASDPKIDKELDREFERLGRETEGFVLDYRLGALFVPQGFHVYLHVDEAIAAARINPAERGNEFIDESLDGRIATIQKRNRVMIDRFINSYGFDFTDPKHYHLVIDTAGIRTENVIDRLLTRLVPDGEFSKSRG